VAGLGGDEFAVLLPATSAAAARQVADGLLKEIAVEVPIADEFVEVGASMGIAVYPDHGDDFTTLLRCADVAIYAAERAGGGVALYSPEQDAHSHEGLALARELREAIAGDQLVVHYQPIVDLRLGQVCSVEALVRWQHPRLGLLYPDSFIPVAEQTGQVCALTRVMIIKAMQSLRRWHAAGRALSVSVNLSPRSLQNPHTAEGIPRLLAEIGAAPSDLTLEITKSMLMAEPVRAREVVRALRGAGIRIAIDDFGTGYSSLAYLKHFPVDVLVAEGVESGTIRDLLIESGCDFAQEYYFSKPLPADELSALLEAPSPGPPLMPYELGPKRPSSPMMSEISCAPRECRLPASRCSRRLRVCQGSVQPPWRTPRQRRAVFAILIPTPLAEQTGPAHRGSCRVLVQHLSSAEFAAIGTRPAPTIEHAVLQLHELRL
jgi:predicted signal transduction protein with EAL and GGDEF domain